MQSQTVGMSGVVHGTLVLLVGPIILTSACERAKQRVYDQEDRRCSLRERRRSFAKIAERTFQDSGRPTE
jgi:hypothetical protein